MDSLLPHVTDIIQGAGLCEPYDNVPPEVVRHAGDRGTAVHEAIRLYFANELDEASLHDEVKPYFQCFLDWWEPRASDGAVVVCSERRLVAYGFEGQVDFVYEYEKDAPGQIITDFKTSAKLHPSVKAQLGGYALLDGADETCHRDTCMALHLNRSGKAKPHFYKKPECIRLFKSARDVFDFRLEHGLIKLQPRR